MRGDYLAEWRMRRDMGAALKNLLYTANAICIRDDLTLVLVTLREKTGCQQTK